MSSQDINGDSRRLNTPASKGNLISSLVIQETIGAKTSPLRNRASRSANADIILDQIHTCDDNLLTKFTGYLRQCINIDICNKMKGIFLDKVR